MTTLQFAKIPDGYLNNQKVLLCGFDLSGIQKFIFNVTTNKGSLREIKQRSQEIEILTETLRLKLENVIDLRKADQVSYSSGKFFFLTKTENRERVAKELVRIQKNVYLSYRGELNLFYGVVEAVVTTDNISGENGYRALIKEIQRNRRTSLNLLEYNLTDDFDYIRPQIKSINHELIEKLVSENNNLVTGIKLDFDNLGKYFGSLTKSDTISDVGFKMKEEIENVVNSFDDIYKIFVGGDDIFILTSFRNTIKTALQIKKELKKAFQKFDYSFSISAGIAYFNYKTSIVYYGEKLENELTNAKASGKNGVSIESNYFTWDELEQINEHIERFVKRFSGKSDASKSQLFQIENTILSIINDNNEQDLIRKFILKIPHFNNRVNNLVPKSLLTFNINKKNEYVREINKFALALKLANRYIRKEG